MNQPVPPSFYAKGIEATIRNKFLLTLRRDAKAGAFVDVNEREAALIQAISAVLSEMQAKLPKPSE